MAKKAYKEETQDVTELDEVIQGDKPLEEGSKVEQPEVVRPKAEEWVLDSALNVSANSVCKVFTKKVEDINMAMVVVESPKGVSASLTKLG